VEWGGGSEVEGSDVEAGGASEVGGGSDWSSFSAASCAGTSSAAACSAGASPSPSTVISAVPCDTWSPTCTLISFTMPANGAGTSIVALSDSSVTSGSSAATVSP